MSTFISLRAAITHASFILHAKEKDAEEEVAEIRRIIRNPRFFLDIFSIYGNDSLARYSSCAMQRRDEERGARFPLGTLADDNAYLSADVRCACTYLYTLTYRGSRKR